MNILRSFFDFVYPRTCAVCGGALDWDGRYVCAECKMRLPFCTARSEALTAFEAPCFDRATSAVRFEAEARELVLTYKFHRGLWLRDDFADWMEAAARGAFPVHSVDCVAGVPWTVLHRLDRGYDPVGILARTLAKRLARPYLPHVLRFRGKSFQQSLLSAEERAEKLHGTLRVRNAARVRGRTVLLVDDILTTGSTASECARVLKDAGAWRVWVLTLARSVRDA